MGRLLVLAAIILFAIWLVRRALRRADGGGIAPPGPADDLVRCAQCDLLLPRREARELNGSLFCTEEHARRGPRRG
jgi:uncharacterized protein